MGTQNSTFFVSDDDEKRMFVCNDNDWIIEKKFEYKLNVSIFEYFLYSTLYEYCKVGEMEFILHSFIHSFIHWFYQFKSYEHTQLVRSF